MEIDEFLDVLLSNIPLYVVSLLLSQLLLIPLYKKVTKGIIDPLFFVILMAGLANAIPFFLFFTNNITTEIFIYFLFAETLFWIGYLINAHQSIVFKKCELITTESKNLSIFLFFLILYVILKLTSYALIGIPIFMEDSRLDVFTGSGLGALERFTSLPVFFSSVYVFHLLNGNSLRLKILAYFSIAIISIFSILSGSKSSIMILVAGFFVYTYFYQGKIIEFKQIRKYFVLLLIVPFIVIILQDSERETNPIETLLVRFIANGDIYFMSMPDNYVDFIQISNKFTYIFKGLLASFRLIDPMQVDSPIGLQLGWSISDIIDGGNFGPNTRPPILGWVLFRWGGLLSSFLIGLFASFLIYKPSKLLPSSILTAIYVGYIYYSLLSFIVDPVLAISTLFDIIINTLVFIIIYMLVYKGRYVLLTKS